MGCSVLNCSETNNIEVHHIRALERHVNKDGVRTVVNKQGKRVKRLAAELISLNRKQIPLCSKHHLEFEKGIFSQLDYAKLSAV
jgi:hypothetical protein